MTTRTAFASHGALALVAFLAGANLDAKDAPTPRPVPEPIVAQIPAGPVCDDGIRDTHFCGRYLLVEGGTDAARDKDGNLICVGDDREPTGEDCDDVDNDCDGQTDEGFHLGQPCGEGAGRCRTQGWWVCSTDPRISLCSAVPDAAQALSEEKQEPRLCNEVDDDCDGLVDNLPDADGDGKHACSGDCDDSAPAVYTGAAEVCGDGIDQDCDGADAPCETPAAPAVTAEPEPQEELR